MVEKRFYASQDVPRGTFTVLEQIGGFKYCKIYSDIRIGYFECATWHILQIPCGGADGRYKNQ